jgi:hypothetical protein
MVRFLVCEMDLDKNKDVKDALKNKPNKEIYNIFKLKELNKTLNAELKSENASTKKLKL